jgi:hypothetical protein
MYISTLKCGPGLLFIGLRWPSVQAEFDMPALDCIVIEAEALVPSHQPVKHNIHFTNE